MNRSNQTLEAAVAPYLAPDKIARFREQVRLQPDTHLTPNAYKAYLQVFTWAVITHLNRAGTLEESQLTEERESPMLNKALKPMFTVLPRDLGFPDVMPAWLLSRVV